MQKPRWTLSKTALLLLAAGCAGVPSEDSSNEAPITSGARVSLAAHHDASPPLTLIAPVADSDTHPEHEVKPIPRHFASQATHDPVQQNSPVSLAIPTTLLNFNGVGNGFTGPQGSFTVQSAPPDTNGDVGPNHYVQLVNSDFAVFNKSGTVVYGPVATNTLWSGFGGGCQSNNDGDGVVLYDPIADRWVISQFSVSTTPYLQCVAVSQTGNPTGAYYRYSFTYTDFPDYPKMGVWPDAYYTTFNLFAGGSTFAGADICAYDRTKMLAGQAATQQCFQTTTDFGGILPADLDGARLPPAGSPNYIVGLGATSGLAYWKFHIDWTTPASTTLTGPTTLATAAYAEACSGGTCVPQSGTTQQLDSLADRLMFRLAYRNFGDHEALVVNHSVTAGSSTGVRWYELRPDASHNLSIFQQGTYAPDTGYRWLGSIAMDQSGNMALGFSLSSSSLHPEIHYTGRLVGDAAGTMTQGEGTIINGPGSQTGSSLSRWGDYSNMAVDPVDDCTFWYTTEYLPANGAFNWATRVGTFKFPGCGGTVTNDFSISASPSTVSMSAGGSGSTTISTAVTSGSAQTVNLSVSGLPTGASASFSPTSVTAGGSSSLSISAGSAAAGTYPLTVTGSGTTTHTTGVTLTITAVAGNDFSISASPASSSIAQGGSGTVAVSTATTSGSAQSVSFSLSGAPSGVSGSFSPASVTSGSGSTLTLTVSASAAAGTYALTITGTAASGSHTAGISLTVTSSGGGGSGITNGGFETGSLSGWTATGAASSVVTGGHGGTYAARVGSTSPTNGDSSIAQTFTAPANATGLSFYYKVVCPDTLTYDWATATLKDNTTGTTATVLAKTCSNSGAWANGTGSLTAGHSYTLTLTSHDDNYASDPTYTLYDDVTITTGSPPPSGITNGGFETGSLSGWTASGASTAAVSGGHSGTYAARLGSTNPTNGDSTIVQTFTAPAGTTSVSFFYKMSCPDTVTYDWATATLKDNTAGTTATVLAKTCATSASWIQKTAAVTGGHSYTLTLTSHDDNYSADPTYTLYDDVTVQ